MSCADYIQSTNFTENCYCNVSFRVPSEMTGKVSRDDKISNIAYLLQLVYCLYFVLIITVHILNKKKVYMYYGLDNFYQNHRRYVRARSDYQLLGNPSYTVGNCEPFRYFNGSTPIAPCGAIANSLFNGNSFNKTNFNS